MLIKKHLFLLYLFCITYISVANDNIPAFFEVSYKLYSNDTKIAKMERRFYKKEANNYAFSSESKTTGLISLFRKDHVIEISNWNFLNSNIIPIHYSYKRTGGKKNRDIEINFNWYVLGIAMMLTTLYIYFIGDPIINFYIFGREKKYYDIIKYFGP